MWEIHLVRGNAIHHLTPLFTPSDAMLKIHLGHRFNVTSWIYDGYSDIVWRNDPVTPEEGRQLGVEAVAKLARVRELRVASECTRRAYAWGPKENGSRLKWCGHSQKLVDERLKQLIRDLFGMIDRSN